MIPKMNSTNMLYFKAMTKGTKKAMTTGEWNPIVVSQYPELKVEFALE
jgi:hypothetical protein